MSYRIFLKAVLRIMESFCVGEITLLFPLLRTVRRTVPSIVTRLQPVWPGPLLNHINPHTPTVGLKLQQNARATNLGGYGEPENVYLLQVASTLHLTFLVT